VIVIDTNIVSTFARVGVLRALRFTTDPSLHSNGFENAACANSQAGRRKSGPQGAGASGNSWEICCSPAKNRKDRRR